MDVEQLTLKLTPLLGADFADSSLNHCATYWPLLNIYLRFIYLKVTEKGRKGWSLGRVVFS